jgi:hypothetical protein
VLKEAVAEHGKPEIVNSDQYTFSLPSKVATPQSRYYKLWPYGGSINTNQ